MFSSGKAALQPFLGFVSFLFFCGYLLLPALVFPGCATPTSPSGGPRDTIGPLLIAEATTPNFQTDFRPREIVLTFDEWVTLDPAQEIIISPPLALKEENRPRLRRRSLLIPLQGVPLRDSVTYVVNVGTAVKDLNEGNPSENIRFVFATGPVLDTSTVSGTILQDYTGKPVDGATFTLYSDLADTAAFTANPTYFAQTDKEGRFTVYNVRPGRYRAIALERNPSATNYFIDRKGYAPPLAIGFQDSLVVIAQGDNTIDPVFLSPVPKPLRINRIDTTLAGRIRLILNGAAQGGELRYRQAYYERVERDTIDLFYRGAARADTFLLWQEGAAVDTVRYGGGAGTAAYPLQLQKTTNTRVNAVTGLQLVANQPLQDFAADRITLQLDSVLLSATFSIDSLQPDRLRVALPRKAGGKYTVTVLPGALTAWSGEVFQDTLERRLTFNAPEEYGTLQLSVEELDSTAQYLLRLLRKEEVVTGSERIIRERSDFSTTYAGLPPDTYRAEIVTDRNRNGRYDAGNFFQQRLPEKVQRFTLDELRANWELEVTISPVE